MFERFTDRARRVLLLGQETAESLGHEWLGCEHLLFGLATGGGAAGQVLGERGVGGERVRAAIIELVGERVPGPVSDEDALASLGIDLAAVRQRLEESFGPGAAPATDRLRRFTPGALHTLVRAGTESDSLNHGYIGTEHLLLAVLADDSNYGYAILTSFDLDPNEVRQAVLRLAAADYLRIESAATVQNRLLRLTMDPATRDSAQPVYTAMTEAIGQARMNQVAAQSSVTRAFADACEAAVQRAEAAATAAGLTITT